jgi:hypothetical protein
MSNSEKKSWSPQRQILPIPDQPYAGFIAYDAKDPDSKFAPIEELRPPQGAPNVVIILLGDVGFGASSAFGGPCQTPTAERLATNGLRYTRFHTTALCSPTRAALLSGRNHHMVGMGGITEIATSAPGYNSRRPNSMAPIAEVLRLNGYSTAQFGKCHEVPVWEASPVGPFDRWPTGSGFEYFYGFVAGETNQWYPSIHEGTKIVDPPATPEQGHHFMIDMTDRAIDWVRQQRLLAGSKPFFMYFAPGATHALITCRRSGQTNIKASLTRAGTNFVKRPSRARKGAVDLRALSPLKWHVNPYGTFTLNMQERLPLEQVGWSPVLVGRNFGLR